MNIQQSSKSKSNSEISHGGTGEIRYKKALRQISKLIALNTSLRKQLQLSNLNYKKIQQEYRLLLQQYQDNPCTINAMRNTPNCMSRELQPTQNGIYSAESNKQRTPQFYLDKQISVNIDNQSNQNYKQQIKKYQQNDVKLNYQIKYLEQRILYFDNTLQQKNQLIHQLELALQKKYLQITQLQGRCGDLNQKLVKSKSSDPKLSFINNQQLNIQKKKNCQLQNKLKNCQEYIKKVSFDYEQLRKKLIFTEKQTTNNSEINYRYMGEAIKYSITQPQIQRRNSSLCGVSRQKHKRTEDELSKLQKQYTQKKLKYKAQIQKLKQDNKSLSQKVKVLNSFIQKQQFYIQNYVSHQKLQQKYR